MKSVAVSIPAPASIDGVKVSQPLFRPLNGSRNIYFKHACLYKAALIAGLLLVAAFFFFVA